MGTAELGQKAREHLEEAATALNGIGDAQASPEVRRVLSQLAAVTIVVVEQERLAVLVGYSGTRRKRRGGR